MHGEFFLAGYLTGLGFVLVMRVVWWIIFKY